MSDLIQRAQVIGFKERTDTRFHKIDGYDAHQIEQMVEEFVMGQLHEREINYNPAGIAITGSRSRGLERPDSDLDVVIEFSTDIKEYVLFNILHEEPFSIGGVPVDINPIREEETGDLGDYLRNAEKYLANKEEKMKYKLEWSSDGCPNNCAYCKEYGYSCIYKDADSPLKSKPYTCSICNKKLAADECYSYKDFDFCEDCFDKGIEEVEELIGKAQENIEARHLVNMPDPVLHKELYDLYQKRYGAAIEIQGKESIYEKQLIQRKLNPDDIDWDN